LARTPQREWHIWQVLYMMSAASSMASGAFSPVTTPAPGVGGAATADLDRVNSGLTIAAEARVPLTFKNVRRFKEGLHQFSPAWLLIIL
jgi:hypothetical protein